MSKQYAAVAVLVTLALVWLSGCGAHTAQKDARRQDLPNYVSRGDEGAITGKVIFTGTPPELEPLNMTSDAACAASGDNRPEVVVVNNGRLKNVFVYVKGAGVDNYRLPVGGPVTLDQKGCRYVPHVLGVQVGQAVRISNSDQTAHNVHPTPKRNDGFNVSQAQGDPALERAFTSEEVMIPVQCNQHN